MRNNDNSFREDIVEHNDQAPPNIFHLKRTYTETQLAIFCARCKFRDLRPILISSSGFEEPRN